MYMINLDRCDLWISANNEEISQNFFTNFSLQKGCGFVQGAHGKPESHGGIDPTAYWGHNS